MEFGSWADWDDGIRKRQHHCKTIERCIGFVGHAALTASANARLAAHFAAGALTGRKDQLPL
jgi:hypothetical protein